MRKRTRCLLAPTTATLLTRTALLLPLANVAHRRSGARAQVATKLLEDSGTELPQDLERQGYPFSPLTSFNCSQGAHASKSPSAAAAAAAALRRVTPRLLLAEALEACRSGAVPFTRDGILFRHKDAHYTPGHSPSPLNLVWKVRLAASLHQPRKGCCRSQHCSGTGGR